MHAPLLTAVLSAAVAALVAWVVARARIRAVERNELWSMVNQVVLLGIQHPTLEDDEFCAAWSPSARDESSMRYDNYCCLLFNALERGWKHFKGDHRKLEDLVYAPEWAWRHRRWWFHVDNFHAYAKGFRAYIRQSIEAELKRKEPGSE